MFIRSCGATNPHPMHEYTHIWKKRELPFLLHPEEYPDSWESPYRCQGVFKEAWSVVYLHPDCAECEDMAERAVESAQKENSAGASYSRMVPVRYPAGVFAEVGHQATVTRL